MKASRHAIAILSDPRGEEWRSAACRADRDPVGGARAAVSDDPFRAKSARNRFPLHLIELGFLVMLAAEVWMRLA
ncbi:hypothetical protein MKK55_09680 [Methylobacterium sp. J-059]|uniref:hypothetical protein n=1 Tax=Methylobacterium sp. J-059 TaxID=2836643 RepID=UPI001FBB8093|nr:hypothetical protein [Methylobacterium sp. J-059]MCJ2039211.1 hypothetical protein [Methylobacterium sp. J-059]